MFDLKNAKYREVDTVSICYNNNNNLDYPEIALSVGAKRLVFKVGPLTKEDEEEYRNGLIECYKNNFTAKEILNYKIDFTLKIIDGFEDKTFVLDEKPVSSTPGNKNYKKNWREVFREYSSDFVLEICKYLLDESCYLVDEYDFVNEIKNLEKVWVPRKEVSNSSTGNLQLGKLLNLKSKVISIFN